MSKKHICIDFEGEAGATRSELRMPSILGAVIPPWQRGVKNISYRCYVIDPHLKAMATPRANALVGKRIYCSLDDAVLDLVKLAERKDCDLVYYARHEKRIIKKFCTDPELIDRFNSLARDVHEEVREVVKNQRFGVPKGELSLERALHKLGCKSETLAKPGEGVGNTCKAIRKAGQQSKLWAEWPRPAKNSARDLLIYNKQDCLAARALAVNLDRRRERHGR